MIKINFLFKYTNITLYKEPCIKSSNFMTKPKKNVSTNFKINL